MLLFMSSLPHHRPQQLSLGPLETEILNLLWDLEPATVKEIHDRILADPDRELTPASVTTVLNRLAKKGWVLCNRTEKAFRWQTLITREHANVLQAHAQFQQFLAVSNPEVVAAFADSLDTASLQQIEAIADRLKAIRQARENRHAP